MLVPIIAAVFALLSPQFSAGGALGRPFVWNRDGCHGANRSPALRWSRPPARTKAFALAMFDPDAGSAGWWHWIVYGIPAERRSFDPDFAARSPEVRQGVNDFGTLGYGGPCPPPGAAHHYVFTLYALDVTRLDTRAPLRGPAFLQAIRSHIIATAKITGIYGR